MEKARKANGTVSRPYLRLAVDLQDLIEEHWTKKKDMPKLKAKVRQEA
jgi:hypothetical protein